MSRRGVAVLFVVASWGLIGCVPPTAPGASPSTTAPSTTAPPTTAPPAGSWNAQMLVAVNAERAAAGVGPLSGCATLERAAQDHSVDQAARRTMSHVGGDGSTLSTRVQRAGYIGWTGIAENVAVGYGSVGAVMTGWMNSSGHRANLLNSSYVHIGVGQAADGSGTLYWTQDFGRGGSC